MPSTKPDPNPPPLTQPASSSPLLLKDESGETFAFRVIRALRDGVDVFLLAERLGAGTLHVLQQRGDLIGLVRDGKILTRVAARLDILQRAMKGDLIEHSDGKGNAAWLGGFDRLQLDGHEILLAADLVDPSLIVAVRREGERVTPVTSEAEILRIRQRIDDLASGIESARTELQAATFGWQNESIEITDAKGKKHRYQAAARLFFEGNDVLFAAPVETPERCIAFRVCGQALEPLADEAQLKRLRDHLGKLRGRAPSTAKKK